MPYRVRTARAADLAGLVAMLARCSPENRFRRFHGNVTTFPPRYLAEVVSTLPEHVALVADTGDQPVALASCRLVSADAAELGVLVEDAHQRLGLGGCLLRSLVDHADRLRVTTLRASVWVNQGWILRLLRPYGDCTVEWSFGVVDVTVHREGQRT